MGRGEDPTVGQGTPRNNYLDLDYNKKLYHSSSLALKICSGPYLLEQSCMKQA
ncbi:MAG: hypothetical protein U5K79_21045 [Cyclobacteriaceae bacterium]|nr:hypothetical protein [Cyclobacteriaceae bacterium]